MFPFSSVAAFPGFPKRKFEVDENELFHKAEKQFKVTKSFYYAFTFNGFNLIAETWFFHTLKPFYFHRKQRVRKLTGT